MNNDQIDLTKTASELPPLSPEAALLATVAAQVLPVIKTENSRFMGKETTIKLSLSLAEEIIIEARKRVKNI